MCGWVGGGVGCDGGSVDRYDKIIHPPPSWPRNARTSRPSFMYLCRAKESVAARVAPKHKRALRRFERAAALGHVEARVSKRGCYAMLRTLFTLFSFLERGV